MNSYARYACRFKVGDELKITVPSYSTIGTNLHKFRDIRRLRPLQIRYWWHLTMTAFFVAAGLSPSFMSSFCVKQASGAYWYLVFQINVYTNFDNCRQEE